MAGSRLSRPNAAGTHAWRLNSWRTLLLACPPRPGRVPASDSRSWIGQPAPADSAGTGDSSSRELSEEGGAHLSQSSSGMIAMTAGQGIVAGQRLGYEPRAAEIPRKSVRNRAPAPCERPSAPVRRCISSSSALPIPLFVAPSTPPLTPSKSPFSHTSLLKPARAPPLHFILAGG